MRINAKATVDKIGVNKWRVEVWGEEPFDFVRTYEIVAPSDNVAARTGIDRFVEEMSKMEANQQ